MEGHCLLKGQQVRLLLRARSAFPCALRNHLGRISQVPALSTMADQTREDRSASRLTVETMNPRVVQMEYAVRGKTPLEAAKIEEAMKRVRNNVVGGVFAHGAGVVSVSSKCVV